MERSNDGFWPKKYNFDELAVGESMEVTGVEGSIRSAASMWGTRYGVWLQVNKIDDGVMRVTRMEAIRERKPSLTKFEQITERLDAIAILLRLVLKKLNEKDEA